MWPCYMKCVGRTLRFQKSIPAPAPPSLFLCLLPVDWGKHAWTIMIPFKLPKTVSNPPIKSFFIFFIYFFYKSCLKDVWWYGLDVKSTSYFSRDPEFNSQQPHCGSWPSLKRFGAFSCLQAYMETIFVPINLW